MADDFKPKTLDDFRLHTGSTAHPGAKQRIIKWFVSEKKDGNVMVVSGPPGVGKSTLVELVCLKYEHSPYVLDMCFFENSESLAVKFGALADTTRDVEGCKFAIILENVDFVGADQARVLTAIMLRVEVPIFAICNNPYSLFARALCQKYQHVRMFPIDTKQMFQISMVIFEATRAPGTDVKRSDVDHIVRSSMGDIRRCYYLTTLTVSRRGDKLLMNPFDVAKVLLSPISTLTDKCRVLESTDDKSLAAVFLHHNYIGNVSNDALFAVADGLSVGDTFGYTMGAEYNELLSCCCVPTELDDDDDIYGGMRTTTERDPKLEFPKKYFDNQRELSYGKTAMVLKVMKETAVGLRYSRRSGLVMDVHQLLTGKGYVSASGKDDAQAAKYTAIAREFGLDAFRDKSSAAMMLRKVQQEQGVKRAKSVTFKCDDDKRQQAQVLAKIISYDPDKEAEEEHEEEEKEEEKRPDIYNQPDLIVPPIAGEKRKGDTPGEKPKPKPAPKKKKIEPPRPPSSFPFKVEGSKLQHQLLMTDMFTKKK